MAESDSVLGDPPAGGPPAAPAQRSHGKGPPATGPEGRPGRRDLKFGTNPFEFSIGDMNRLPVLYYNTYGVGHNGSPCIDNDDSWTCPHCHRTFNTTLATLPDYCQVCGETTPMGRMIEDGILRR